MTDRIPIDGIGIKNHKIRQQKLCPQLVDQVLELWRSTTLLIEVRQPSSSSVPLELEPVKKDRYPGVHPNGITFITMIVLAPRLCNSYMDIVNKQTSAKLVSISFQGSSFQEHEVLK